MDRGAWWATVHGSQKVGHDRETSLALSGSQETPGITGKLGLGVQNETGKRLIEFCQENALFIEKTLFQKHKRRLYTWTSPDDQHRNQIGYIL